MGFEVIMPPPSTGGGGGGPVAWADITGKPAIATTISDPGSDTVLAGEQAVRESLNKVKTFGFSWVHELPAEGNHVVTDDWPVDVNCTITEITTKGIGGGATVGFKINGTNITNASAIAVTTSELETVPSGANVMSEGIELSYDISALDEECTAIRFTVKYERAN